MTGYNYINRSSITPQRLSAKLYGKWTLYKVIVDVNPSIKNNIIRPGLILFIPDIFIEDSFHVIVDGDSYEKLSLQYYGTEHFSGLIFSTNNGLVLEENIGNEIIIPGL